MKFNLGDRVKFLNQSGGGIVSKIISPMMVNVMTRDGFEIPTLASEIIKIDNSGKVASMFDEEVTFKQKAGKGEDEKGRGREGEKARNEESKKEEDSGDAKQETERQSPLANLVYKTRNAPGIYLAFVPHDQKWFVKGLVEIYLINHTPFDVLYAIFQEGEKFLRGKDYDIIFSGNKILLDAVAHENLSDWSEGIIQMIFFQEDMDKVYMPVSTTFDISSQRYNMESSYVASQFMEEQALLVSLVKISSLSPILSRDDSHLAEGFTGIKKAEDIKAVSLIEKHQTGPRMAVVDLHIEELTERHEQMSSQEILRYQMDYFTRCIESAVDHNFRTVTFIHGVGNGTLKNAIIKKISEYEHAESHLASLAKFGVGAIDVYIKPMK